MNKLHKNIQGIRTFLGEVIGEMKKATWPERQELLESTIVVIISVFMLSLFVGVSDKLLVTLLRLLIPSG